MKKTVLFSLLFFVSFFIWGQKTKRTNVYLRGYYYPVHQLPSDIKTYSIECRSNVTVKAYYNDVKILSAAMEGIQFESLQYKADAADLIIKIELNPEIFIGEVFQSPLGPQRSYTYKNKYTVSDKHGRTLLSGIIPEKNYSSVISNGIPEPDYYKNVADQCKTLGAEVQRMYDFHHKVDDMLCRYVVGDGYEQFDALPDTLKKIFDKMLVGPDFAKAKSRLKPSIDYLESLVPKINTADKKANDILFAIYNDLAYLNVFIEEFEQSQLYIEKLQALDSKDGYVKNIINWRELKMKNKADYYRNKELIEKGELSIYVSGNSSNTNQSPVADEKAVLRGFIVLNNDTLFGQVINYVSNLPARKVDFIPFMNGVAGTKKTYSINEVKAVYVDTYLFRPIGPFKKSALVGDMNLAEMDNRTFFKELYISDSVGVYLSMQNERLILYNKNRNKYEELPGPAKNYWVGKKEAKAVYSRTFDYCSALVAKMEAGEINLEEKHIIGVLHLVQEGEKLCGNNNFEKSLMQNDSKKLDARVKLKTQK